MKEPKFYRFFARPFIALPLKFFLHPKVIGLEKVGCIHINDSKNEKGAHKDRHENIGLGTIGFDTLCKIVHNPKLDNIPKILETPYVEKEYPPYKEEIDMLRKKKFDPKFIEKVKGL